MSTTLLLVFDRLPDRVDLSWGARRGPVSFEDMRVAADQLVAQPDGDVLHGELTGLLSNRGVEVDLKQEVTELFAEQLGVA